MYELNECLRLTREIKAVAERLEELRTRAMSPKNQVITGMPKGGGMMHGSNEEYIIKQEKLNRKKERLSEKRSVMWERAYSLMLDKGAKKDHIELMWLRFYKGLKWAKCCAEMQKKHPNRNYNINLVFRIYRNIAKNS